MSYYSGKRYFFIDKDSNCDNIKHYKIEKLEKLTQACIKKLKLIDTNKYKMQRLLRDKENLEEALAEIEEKIKNCK